jgi:ribose transport system substrate-binding protein
VLAPLDDRALVKPIENAAGAGIPVVVIDSGVETDKFTSFVSTDNFEGGRLGGEHLAGLLGGKGNVILVRYQEGSASTARREDGFLAAIQKYPDLKILSSNQYSGSTRETALRLAENLGRTYGDQLDGVFCPCEPVTVTMVKALKDLNLAGGKVKIVGFDASEASVNDLKAGDVQALVLQDPVNMGYMGVKTIMAALNGAPVEKRIDTGVSIITQANMNEPGSQELLYPPLKEYLGE